MAGIPLSWNPSPRKIQLFWKKIERLGPDDCWLCKNERHGKHPQSRLNGWYTSTYRIAFILDLMAQGRCIPDNFNKLNVCHNCDEPWCCNPAHLWLGTQGNNLDDMRIKGRAGDCRIFGERHGRCVVTDAQVEEIIALYASGEHSQRDLAKRFGLGCTQISRIVRGETRIKVDRKTTGMEASALAAARKEATDLAAWSKKGGRHMAEFEDRQIQEICWLARNGSPHVLLAEMHNVARQTIDQIVNGETYKHVDRDFWEKNGHYAPPFSIDHWWDFLDGLGPRKAEANRKRSEAMKGRKFSAEHRSKLSLAARNRKKLH